jgi:hypothetical protein
MFRLEPDRSLLFISRQTDRTSITLTFGSIAKILTQIPAGALVDRLHS